MILNQSQSAAVESLLRHVNAVANGGTADQPLTLLAVALVLSCQNYGVAKKDALTVIGGLFDDDSSDTLMLMPCPSGALH